MASNTQKLPLAGPRPVLWELLQAFGDKAALALGLLGALTAALFFCAPWVIAIIGAAVVLVLSVTENEKFLLFVIFLTPIVWVLKGDTVVRNVSAALHFLVFAGFFAGRLLRREVRLGYLLRPAVSQASLLFLCAAVFPTLILHGRLTHQFGSAAYQLATYIAFYFVVLAWVDSQERMRKALWMILLSAVGTAAFAFYQQIVGGYTSLWMRLNAQDEFALPWVGRSSSFMGHPNSLAFYLNLVLPFALACTVLGHGRWKKLGGWTFGLGFIALLTTQSLGGLIGFASVLILAIFCFVPSGKKRLALLAGTFVIVCGFYVLRPVLNPNHTQEVLGDDAVTRLLLWNTAWDEFVNNPGVGLGWGNFAAPYDWNIPFAPGMGEPHNLYLQLLSETGVVGFLAFFNLLVQSWRQARHELSCSEDFLCSAVGFGVLGALLALLVHGSVDIPFFSQSETILWELLAFLVASDRLRTQPGGGKVALAGAPA